MEDEETEVVETEATEPEEDAHVCDHSACAAKVESLTGELAAKDDAIADIAAELTVTKAANYDLLIAIPSDPEPEPESVDDASDGDIDDFFV